MNEKLKSCPFCGGEATVEKVYKQGWYNVTCSNCYVQTQNYTYMGGAIDAWNTRDEVSS